MAYFTRAQLEARLSKRVVDQIYDDDNDGTADTDPLDQVTADADAIIDSAIEAIYDLPLAVVPPRVTCLALDAAEMLAARRHREYVKKDWRALKEELDKDLSELRRQRRTVGKAPPDPAANQGGAVYPTPDPTTGQNLPIFSGGGNKWGIF